MKWLALATGLSIALYAVYALTYPTYSYRWRVTIEVNTRDGVKVGSSVFETKTVQVPYWVTMGTAGSWTSVRGEATFVDLGQGRHVIALVALGPNAGDDRASLFVPRAFFPVQEGSPHLVDWSRVLSALSGRRRYGPPTLVRFGDLNDPATIQEVPFGRPGEVLGPEVLGVEAWVDLTKDPVTDGLEARLPWIKDKNSVRLAFNAIRTASTGGSAGPEGLFTR